MSQTYTILPGATLGVLGGGQLGRMFAIAARRMGYRVHVFSPQDDTPTGQVADVEVTGEFEDLDAVERFAASVAAVTFEFENIPLAATQAAAKHAPVRPGGGVLHVSQHRLREKGTLAARGLPVTPFRAARSAEEAVAAVAELGEPAVVKTAAWGYDGKGQRIARTADAAAGAWAELSTDEAVVEAFIDYECELSVVAARGVGGDVQTLGPIRNDHVNHILDVSTCPTDLPPRVERDALEIARGVVEVLEVVGVLCVEFFLTRDGRLLINELAPRPHNSGHLTIDAFDACQFEQQVRAVCGLPLASPRQHRPAAMANLLGDVWVASKGTPNWPAALALPGVKLHLYGKHEARPGRKMGHLTALADTPEAARALAVRGRGALTCNV